MRSIKCFANLRDTRDIGMQPSNSHYLKQLNHINCYIDLANKEDEMLCDDSYETNATEI